MHLPELAGVSHGLLNDAIVIKESMGEPWHTQAARPWVSHAVTVIPSELLMTSRHSRAQC